LVFQTITTITTINRTIVRLRLHPSPATSAPRYDPKRSSASVEEACPEAD